MTHTRLLIALAFCGLSLTACSSTKEKLGLEKTTPDEFAVVRRAPLALPPGYELRPPQPGAPRPQEQSSNEQARQVVFGEATQQTSQQQNTEDSAEKSFLSQAGATKADPNIRQKVDAESKDYDKSNIPLGKRILNMGSDEAPASIVDAKKEAQRLQENAQEGKPVTEGETPTIED